MVLWQISRYSMYTDGEGCTAGRVAGFVFLHNNAIKTSEQEYSHITDQQWMDTE